MKQHILLCLLDVLDSVILDQNELSTSTQHCKNWWNKYWKLNIQSTADFSIGLNIIFKLKKGFKMFFEK